MAKIIIGIHGLGNKPQRELLERWWTEALQEGLTRIGKPGMLFKFKMVYWADILHPTPLEFVPGGNNCNALDEPYFPISFKKPEKQSELRRRVLDYLEKQIDELYLKEDLTIDISRISDRIIHHYFRDLESYYSTTEPAVKDSIRNRLYKALQEYRRDQILLIAHSMGSIVSFDVLTGLAGGIDIDTFITIGSPLGIPVVINKMAAERQIRMTRGKKPGTPENILQHWYNFSDLYDKVAFNYNLGDDYQANSRGVFPVDAVVFNDYQIGEQRNPHKSYGYLRTPELSQVVFDFLTRERSRSSGCLQHFVRLFRPEAHED